MVEAHPSPHPPLHVLIALHARLVVREAVPSTAVLAAAALALPLLTLATLAPGAATPLDTAQGPPLTLSAGFVWLTLLVTLFWPDTVWRNLGLGERTELDALPVSRRRHRTARLVGGAAVPLIMGVSAFGTAAILDHRGWLDTGEPLGLQLVTGSALPGAALALVAAYLLSSIFALRFGRVFLPLVLVGMGVLVVPLAMAIAFEGRAMVLLERLFVDPYSPGANIFLFAGEGGTLPPLLWVCVLGLIAAHFAGAHDHA